MSVVHVYKEALNACALKQIFFYVASNIKINY